MKVTRVSQAAQLILIGLGVCLALGLSVKKAGLDLTAPFSGFGCITSLSAIVHRQPLRDEAGEHG